MLAFQGHLACCVGMPDFAAVQPLPRGVQLTDIALGWAYISGDRRAQVRLADYGHEMGRLLATGAVDPMVEVVFELDQAIAALRRSRSGRQRGKLVIRVS
jgi:NADPH:quinone reductase-like Zn-dependent oxidoreductase